MDLPDLKQQQAVNNDSLASQPASTTSVGADGPFRERVEAFYRTYNPTKISAVDRVLKQYEGNEAACIEALIQKYGPEPGAVPATAETTKEQPVAAAVTETAAVTVCYHKEPLAQSSRTGS